MKTQDIGIEIYAYSSPLELWCDAEFCGCWDLETAHLDKNQKQDLLSFMQDAP